jgi:hypothetical protein
MLNGGSSGEILWPLPLFESFKGFKCRDDLASGGHGIDIDACHGGFFAEFIERTLAGFGAIDTARHAAAVQAKLCGVIAAEFFLFTASRMCGGITSYFACIIFADIADGTANLIASNTAETIFFAEVIFADLSCIAAHGNAINGIIASRLGFLARGDTSVNGIADLIAVAASGIASSSAVIASFPACA